MRNKTKEEEKQNKGKIIIIAGPSGVGKSTIVQKIIKKSNLPKLKFSVSLTTRKPRPHEINGIHYHFVSENDFLNAIKNDELLEYAVFIDHYYGTKKNDVNNWIKNGYNVILEIEINGAKQVLKKYPKDEIISFFIIPPSLEELKNRIKNRSTEKNDDIKHRLEKADAELKLKSYFNYVIINDDCDRATQEIIKIIKKKLNTKNDFNRCTY